MPYAGVSPEDTERLDDCVAKLMAQGHTKPAAIGMCRSKMNLSQTVRWLEPFNYSPGAAFRVMPIGQFKRGERTLDITPADIGQMAANYEAQRPRWKIPIYAGHPTPEQPDPPKIGNVTKLEARQDGLYAYPEWSEDGERLAKSGYQYNSPGVLWQKNGSEYVDEQGQKFDNVIDHVALSNRPFFGANTQLFSADPLPENLSDYSDAHLGAMKKAWTKMQELMGAMQETLSGWANGLPDHKRPGSENLPAMMQHPAPQKIDPQEQESMSEQPAQTGIIEDTERTVDTMAENTQATPTAPEQMSAEQFAAYKAAFDAENKKLAEQLNAVRQQADTFAEQLQTERRTRRLEQLTARCEGFSALPGKANELAEKLLALEEKDADLATYFTGKLEAANKLITEGSLFSELSARRPAKSVESFAEYVNQVLAEQYGNDKRKYTEAFHKAAELRPDLANEYRLAPQAQ